MSRTDVRDHGLHKFEFKLARTLTDKLHSRGSWEGENDRNFLYVLGGSTIAPEILISTNFNLHYSYMYIWSFHTNFLVTISISPQWKAFEKGVWSSISTNLYTFHPRIWCVMLQKTDKFLSEELAWTFSSCEVRKWVDKPQHKDLETKLHFVAKVRRNDCTASVFMF